MTNFCQVQKNTDIYPINFTQPKEIFALSLHYNGTESF